MGTVSLLRWAVVFLFLIILVTPLRQVNAKECTIYAVEEPSIDRNWFNHNAAKAAKEKGYLVVRHKDIFDLESKVVKKATDEGCTCIKELYIVGHASSEQISVGCGAWKANCAKKEYIALDNKSTWEGTFSLTLKSHFCKDPKIVFYGCAAGVCTKASQVLHTIATKSGATVQAPIAIIVNGSKLFDYLTSGEWQYGYPTAANAQACKKGKFISVPAKVKKASYEYYCPCNQLAYTGIVECTNGCKTSLSCFANICDAYYRNNTWDTYSGNPIVVAGASGSWNESGVSQPTVLRASPYAMWFSGWDSSNLDSIGYATSNYGITWTHYASNPVLTSGASGSWDDYGVYGPCVIKEGGTYKMWYTGYSASSKVAQIGYATSTDGSSWTKHSSNPVLTIGSSGKWDEAGVGAPSVIKDGSTYKMWFGGSDVAQWWQIGYATSTDGISWTKYASNPVVTYGFSGSWNAWGVDAPSVVKDSSTYHMLYIGLDGSNVGSIGYAHSTDGISWTESPDNPHFSRSYREDGFDTINVGHPALIKDSNESAFKAYYRGKNSSTWAIGYGGVSPLGLSATTTTTVSTTSTLPGSSTTTTISSPTSTTTSVKKKLCFLKALYDDDAEEIEVLRVFRDEVLRTTPEGQELIELYYQWSPIIVHAIEEDEEFKDMVKGIIDALVLKYTGHLESINP